SRWLEPEAVRTPPCPGCGHHHLPQRQTPTGTAVTFHRASHGRGRPGKDVLALRSAMRSRGPVTAASAPGGRRTRVPVAEASDGVTRRWSADGDRDEPEQSVGGAG